ncbi:MAG: hypothetical protein MJZ21_00325 [archaeon]|nr:hypothetical protein [archaeon]
MAGVCTTESNPESKVSAFVSDSSMKSLSGNREQGLDGLMDVIREEVLRQNPGTKIILVDRDFMGEHKVLTSRELGAALIDLTFGETSAVFMTESVPIIQWQEALEYLDRETTQFYFGSHACGHIPLCVKLF